ncbi:STAS domain-containing protein [Streptacidiphilus carbonis]|uniref:STAS domain-containing protein n=1 Tax=Streptacidiphilus carbonis TaxID=105422 RepID=UPI0005AA4BE5|nr:STAS domain-containing protein [Streptacidiphilus carbonis]
MGEGVFGLWHRRTGGALVIGFSGELDVWAWEQLGPLLAEALDGHRGPVLVDLRAVTFLDASGVKLLLRIQRQQACLGRRGQLLRGEPRVTKVMRLVRLEQEFDVLDRPPAEPPDTPRAGAGAVEGPVGPVLPLAPEAEHGGRVSPRARLYRRRSPA